MPVHRPISAQLPADPWEVRPMLVPMPAGDQSNRIAADPVVRGPSIMSMSRMALPRSTTSGSTNYTMNGLWARRYSMDDSAKTYTPPQPGYPKVKASRRAEPAACPRPDNDGDPQGVLCFCPAGSIGELSYLRGKPVRRSE